MRAVPTDWLTIKSGAGTGRIFSNFWQIYSYRRNRRCCVMRTDKVVRSMYANANHTTNNGTYLLFCYHYQ